MIAKKTGNKGENAAARYLKRHGYTIVDKNYSCRFGEIDIIAEDKDYIVFVEVKTRNENTIATPGEFVDLNKQNRIIKTAQMYMSFNGMEKQPRFDVIEVRTEKKLKEKIHHIKNAFGV